MASENEAAYTTGIKIFLALSVVTASIAILDYTGSLERIYSAVMNLFQCGYDCQRPNTDANPFPDLFDQVDWDGVFKGLRELFGPWSGLGSGIQAGQKVGDSLWSFAESLSESISKVKEKVQDEEEDEPDFCDSNMPAQAAAQSYATIALGFRNAVDAIAPNHNIRSRDVRLQIAYTRVRNNDGECVGVAAVSNLRGYMVRIEPSLKSILDSAPNVQIAATGNTHVEPTYKSGHSETNLYNRVRVMGSIPFSTLRAIGVSYPPCSSGNPANNEPNCQSFFQDPSRSHITIVGA